MWQPSAVPYGRRRAFAAAEPRRPARRNSESRERPSGRPFRFPKRTPTFSRPQCGSRAASRRRLPRNRARAAAAGTTGRGLCAWVHAPARTPGVLPAAATPRPRQTNNQQEFQQNNEQQMNNHWGRVTHPPAPSFPARIQAGRSRRLPPIPDAPHGHGLTARRSFAAIPAAAAAPSSQRNAEFASDRAQGFLLLRTRRRRVIRSGTVAGGLSAAASRRKALRKPKVASDRAASRFGFRSARRFHIPGVAAAPLRADGCHATGRGRRQPVRRGAVFARGYKPQPACPPSCRLPPAATPRHDQHQCKLPRQLSAEGLARAFAPRRATGGLVRNPPASDAYRGESRSLGEGYTPPDLAAVPTSPAFPSRGVPLCVSSARRGRCSNLPFHAKLLHRPFFHVAAPAAPRQGDGRGCRLRRVAAPRDPAHIPFSRDRLPHGDGLARPARIATAGSPAHACHKGTAAATRFESPLRDYPAPPMRQHPEPAAAWGLGASAHRDPKPIPSFVPGCHALSPRAFSKGRFPTRCGSASVVTAATRGAAAQAQTAATRFRPGHFSKAGSPCVAAQAPRRLPRAGVWHHKRRRLPYGFAHGIFQRPVSTCGSSRGATAATRSVWQHTRRRLPCAFAEGIFQSRSPRSVAAHAQRRLPRGACGSTRADGCHAVSPRAFSKGRFPNAVWQHRARDGCHAGRVAAHAQTADTRFRRGHFSKAGSPRCGSASAAPAATRFQPSLQRVAGLVAASVAAQLGGRGALR